MRSSTLPAIDVEHDDDFIFTFISVDGKNG